MNKLKRMLLMSLMMTMVIGCSSNNTIELTKDTIEYGADISKVELFIFKNGDTKPEQSMNIDAKEVGTYNITAKVDKESLTKDIKVVDNQLPEIELNQSSKEVFEVPLKREYDLKGNLKKVSDKIDGEIKAISIVKKEEYEKLKEELNEYKKKINERVFKSEDELKKAAGVKREKNLCVFISSEINTQLVGEYDVRIMAVDYNYNTTEVVYKIKVVEKVNNAKLAVGIEEKSTESSNKKSSKSTVSIESTESPQSVSTSNKVVKAALARVGQKFWCDELVSQALVDAGVLTGDSKRFPGGFLALSCYSSIGKNISKSQLSPGDVLYYDDAGSGLKHVAIYAGGDKAIHGGSSGGKVVFGRVNIGKGPSKYYRMPSHFTWDEASKMVFGGTQSDIENGNISNPGGANSNIEVYTQRTVTKNFEKFAIEGVNIDVSAVDKTIDQFLANQINRDNFVGKIKGLGCTVDIKNIEATSTIIKTATFEGATFIMEGPKAKEAALDGLVRQLWLAEIDEATFTQKVKDLGYTIEKQ